MRKQYQRWAILWPSEDQDYLLGNPETGMTLLFRTRQQARDHSKMTTYNKMLRRRPDLRRPPHNWKARKPVKVSVTIERDDRGQK